VHERYKKFQCVKCDFGFWKIMGGRQIEPAEAETLLSARELGPLDGFRSRLGRPFSAKLRLNDDNEVEFDFGPRAGDDDEAVDFSGQVPLGRCPKDGGQVFETPNAYVCENAVGAGRTCDFRSGRTILTRPIERAQMEKLLEHGKSDLLQFVSARTRRPFSAFLVRQPDGKIGFEFEAKGEGKGRGRPQRAAALRVLGKHPRDGGDVELHAGRYGPYVKHGSVNATLPDKDKADSLTLDEALEILAERTGKPIGGRKRAPVKRAPRVEEPVPSTMKRAPRPSAGNVARAATRKVAKTTQAPVPAPRTAKKSTKTAKRTATARTAAKRTTTRK
jgi:DNA topoisomerase-3